MIQQPGQAPQLIVHRSGFDYCPETATAGLAGLADRVPIIGRHCPMVFETLCEARFPVLRSTLLDSFAERGYYVECDTLRSTIRRLRRQLRDGFGLEFDPIRNLDRLGESRWELIAENFSPRHAPGTHRF